MAPQFDVPGMDAFLRRAFPQAAGRFEIVALPSMGARLRMPTGDADLRPGGTVSGPTLFALADCAFYVAVLNMIGPEALAVTTSASLDFMRKAPPGALHAEARILKLGRVLVVGDVLITADGCEGPVVRASLTYSVPPPR